MSKLPLIALALIAVIVPVCMTKSIKGTERGARFVRPPLKSQPDEQAECNLHFDTCKSPNGEEEIAICECAFTSEACIAIFKRKTGDPFLTEDKCVKWFEELKKEYENQIDS